MRCPACGVLWERHRKQCVNCGAWRVPAAEEVKRRPRRDFHGGYFYPLNLQAALDLATGEAYGQACADRDNESYARKTTRGRFGQQIIQANFATVRERDRPRVRRSARVRSSRQDGTASSLS